MSEFSESFHFPNCRQDQIAAKLKAAGMKGMLFGPSRTGWVTFVPFEGCDGHKFLAGPYSRFGANLSQFAAVPVLEWVYAQDHLWFAILWNKGELAAQYICDWSEGPPQVTTEGDVLKFQELPCGEGEGTKIPNILTKEVDQKSIYDFKNPYAYRLAEVLGLPKYQWTSSQYLSADIAGKQVPTDGILI